MAGRIGRAHAEVTDPHKPVAPGETTPSKSRTEPDKPGRVGLVLSGGGVRGAYEVGVLAELLPVLEEAGQRPTIYVGTSVGAINAAFLAATHAFGASDSMAVAVDHWRDVTMGRIVRPIVMRQVPLTFLRYAGEILSLPKVRLPSLLDTAPLAESLKSRWVDWNALTGNVRSGLVDAVATVATATRTGRTVAFYDGNRLMRKARSHLVDYVKTPITNEHVRASAAIPIFFPPVRVNEPHAAAGWYIDGGTRLNTPIKPALDLGADRLIVIGTHSIANEVTEPGRQAHEERQAPDFGEGALHVLQGMLVDRVIEDVRLLGNINTFFAHGDDASGSKAADDYRAARGKPPYKVVPYIFIAPRYAGVVGALATDVFRRKYGGLKGLMKSPDFPLLNRLLGRESPTHGSLLSYLFFDPEFISELIDMGRADARSWLAEHGDNLWRTEPLPILTSDHAR